MNEVDFKKQWESEKHLYDAWGKKIVSTITIELEKAGKKLDCFLKIPAKHRLKDDKSLIDKAFYRPNKNYTDPYVQIEDKVGARFVVLLIEDIEEIYRIITNHKIWTCHTCKNFEEEKKQSPLLFTYQSVHCILRPTHSIQFNEVEIPPGIPCEVQIRTLLQHAHAELTHDAIYKSQQAIKPQTHRTVAKSMALIETTDDFFSSVFLELNNGPIIEHNIIENFNKVFNDVTGLDPNNQKSTIIILDSFEQIIDEHLVDNVREFINTNQYIIDIIKQRYLRNNLYQQSIILFIYWMMRKRLKRLLSDWPLPRNLLEPLAIDLGINISEK